MATNYGTAFVGRRAAENALHGVRFSTESGRPINTAICVNFSSLGFDDSLAGSLFSNLQARVSRWWRYQRKAKGRDIGDLSGIFSHANPRGSRHVHWLIHAPSDIWDELKSVIEKRLQKISGVSDLGEALDIRPVEAPGGKAKYILRGIEPGYAEYLHIDHVSEGTVSGRRTGVSRSISKAARKRAGWVRKRSRNKIS